MRTRAGNGRAPKVAQRMIVLLGVAGLMLVSGCQVKLKEVRSKSRFGSTFRHRSSDRTDSVRWTVQQGVQFKWSKGIRTGITYRRRDVDEGNGNHDNGVFVDVSFPIWKAKKKPSRLKKRVKKLEKRVVELEALLTKSGEP